MGRTCTTKRLNKYLKESSRIAMGDIERWFKAWLLPNRLHDNWVQWGNVFVGTHHYNKFQTWWLPSHMFISHSSEKGGGGCSSRSSQKLIQFPVRACLLVYTVILLYPHMEEGTKEHPEASFKKAPIPVIRNCPCDLFLFQNTLI